MAVANKPQIGMEDVWLEDAELEQLLEEREEAKEGRTTYLTIDKKVKARMQELHEEDRLSGPGLRVGRFVLAAKTTAPRSVNFETSGGTRFSISLAEESEDD